MIPVAATDQAAVRNVQVTIRNERQLQADLRAAGLI
jgi:small nuclear ribonucleoprotein (snRNP)-like protein